MKVLHLAHRLPYPPNKGDKIRTYNILSHLASRHQVCLATLIDDPEDLQYIDTMSAMVEKFEYARIDSLARKAMSLRRLFTHEPISTMVFHHRQLQRAVDAMIDDTEFDLILCSSSPMAEYVFKSRHYQDKLRAIPRILDLIDVDSVKWREYAEVTRPPMSWIYRHEAKYLADYERLIYADFDRLLLVSEKEKTQFPASGDLSTIHAVPNGVDLEFFAPRPESSDTGEGPTLVFTGMMDYWPNIDGVRWFIEKCFPLIRRRFANARLMVVGGRPTAEVESWGDIEGITVTGFVDDIRDYLSMADVCVVPLRVARGIQNKVLEAMAMGKPVVLSGEALEGIAAEPGRDVLVARRPGEFADAITSLIEDDDLAGKLGAAARQCVLSGYNWSGNLSLIDDMISELSAPDVGQD